MKKYKVLRIVTGILLVIFLLCSYFFDFSIFEKMNEKYKAVIWFALSLLMVYFSIKEVQERYKDK
ncbi:MAG: hypothetical protein KGV44_15500 [Flavobacteriaceae bacterium]|nr:hypothetical protein [Flavobacteriaceae bacterium]